MKLRRAQPDDRLGVDVLVSSAALPLQGIADHLGNFFVADDRGEIVGVGGLELYGRYALLRSVVVASHVSRRGIGRELVGLVLDAARSHGVEAVYLLTTTAAAYFESLGFDRVERGDLPAQVDAGSQLLGACPASATVMRRRIGPPS